MTQLEAARKGIVTDAMKKVAKDEGLDAEAVRAAVASGEAVIPLNIHHKNAVPVGVGRKFTTKINANLGRSVTHSGKGDELEKLKVALDAGADFVMDLSVASSEDEIAGIRQGMLDASPKPLGTVPIYETISLLGDIPKMDPKFLIGVIRRQAEQGVDFMTLHAGLLLSHIPNAMKRKMGIVSRGGSFIAGWMLHNEQENPLYEHFDDILDICEKYDVTISLGDGMRPGCTSDATDRAQLTELITLGSLVDRAWRRGVQVMVEGPGHVPFDQIKANMQLEKRLCRNAPFYVLGPLVTDIAPGYDHITSAIGGTLAAASGADFLCYVTPAEHLALPTIEDVHTGVITARIAAHAADLVKNVPGVREWDRKMAEARKQLDWKAQMDLAIDPELARQKRGARNPEDEKACSMCGDYCAVEIIHKYFDKRECPFDD